MTNEGEVYFALYGNNFDPDEVTRRVGVEPTSVLRRGEPTPKHSWWMVSSGKMENRSWLQPDETSHFVRVEAIAIKRKVHFSFVGHEMSLRPNNCNVSAYPGAGR